MPTRKALLKIKKELLEEEKVFIDTIGQDNFYIWIFCEKYRTWRGYCPFTDRIFCESRESATLDGDYHWGLYDEIPEKQAHFVYAVQFIPDTGSIDE